MARIVKIDNAIKKRFERIERKRVEGNKQKKVYFLIVCEGVQTEPNYFEALKESLANQTVIITDMTVKGTGRNTTSLIDFTIRYRKSLLQQFDSVWAVFDRDSFTDHQFNNAIEKAAKNDIKTAWSNEAFELWFLLHFQYVNHAMPRQDYQKRLEKVINSLDGGGKYKYQKNSKSTFATINTMGSQDKAIHWAKKLLKEFNDEKYASHNPCTKVFELVEELLMPQSLLKDDNC